MTVQPGYRILENQKGCKYARNYWEDVVGDGGQKMQMFDCEYDGFKNTKEPCPENNTCLAYEPEETTICKIHDVEYSHSVWCNLCFQEED